MIGKIHSYWQTLIYDLRYQAFYVTCWRAVVKLVSPLAKLDLQILFDLDLTQEIPWRQATIDCSIEQAGIADVDEILDMQLRLLPPEAVASLNDEEELHYAQMCRARGTTREKYVGAMRAGELCFVARVEGRIAHSNWIRFHDCGWVDGRPVDLQPGEIYSTDGFTAEEWRGKKLHEAVATHQLRVAKARGCHRAYTITDLTKAGSRRGVLRIGWRRRGQILYITPRGLGRSWLLRLGGDLEPMFRHARALMAES